MAKTAIRSASERRSEHLLNDILVSQGWDIRRPPAGDLLLQNEYRAHSDLCDALAKASKTGYGIGIPEGILIDKETFTPLAVIEVKKSSRDLERAVSEAQEYANALWDYGWKPLAIGLAGMSEDEFELRVLKRNDRAQWFEITYEGYPINWIPTRTDLERIATPGDFYEIRPTIPPLEVLAARADEINRLLREARIKDEFRPATVAAVMLALWHSKGVIRRSPQFILRDINESCRDAFIKAGKADLAKSLRVDEANDKLKLKARRIARILELLNVTVLTAEHDYLGQLYETFFRYTGGNTIGQYFTPRHITKMMAEVCEVGTEDIVIDPACGTGGFLVACMDRLLREFHLSREQVVKHVKDNLIGFEDEPVTAALCIANMILRGDGSTGVKKGDCFSSLNYPMNHASVALMNPPFPHAKTDTSVELFLDRALDALRDRGKLAIILPMSLLVKKDKAAWRKRVLSSNTLLSVCQLPDELFQPFASATTAFIVIEKGVPHNPKRKTMFVRLHHDGLILKKGTRVERLTEPNQIPDAIDAMLNKVNIPGFAISASIQTGTEWAPGAYIESSSPEEDELKENVDILLRRLASFYTRYAKEIVLMRRAIFAEDITVQPYREMISEMRITNAKAFSSESRTIGGMFDIYYGMKELHSRDGIPPGLSLIISPTEQYNGCYGWLEFPKLILAPFVTVAQTGSIGESFVQLEPCAVNDDCLILLPKKSLRTTISDLVLAAACLQTEKWRFTYGRKLTPSRIAGFRIPSSISIAEWVNNKLYDTRNVITASLYPYQTEDERDAEIAQMRIEDVCNGHIIKGADLEIRLAQLELE